MNCHDIEKYVYVYLDEEFDRRDTVEFEDHLRACDRCREVVRAEEHFRVKLRHQLHAARAPLDLRSRILATLDDPDALATHFGDDSGHKVSDHRRYWLSGALVAGIATVAFSALAPHSALQGTELEGTRQAGVVNTASMLPKRVPGSAVEELLGGSTDDFLQDAVNTHQIDPPPHEDGSRTAMERFLETQQGITFMPPLLESYETRLIGVGVVPRGASKVVVYRYDHGGRRVTAIQYPLAASMPVIQNIVMESRRSGYNVVTFGQSEDTLTSIVTDLPVSETLALIGGPQSR
jgi:anti-sigma factor (TIGR02949 family)